MNHFRGEVKREGHSKWVRELAPTAASSGRNDCLLRHAGSMIFVELSGEKIRKNDFGLDST